MFLGNLKIDMVNPFDGNTGWSYEDTHRTSRIPTDVPQVSKPAVSPTSKSAGPPSLGRTLLLRPRFCSPLERGSSSPKKR